MDRFLQLFRSGFLLSIDGFARKAAILKASGVLERMPSVGLAEERKAALNG